MKFIKRSGCYFNCGKPSRMPKSHFCSDKCAAEWAEAMIDEGIEWCPHCQGWIDGDYQHDMTCPNYPKELPF